MGDRHQFRAKWHNYAMGIYFVTICTHNRAHILGHISHDNITLSGIGLVAQQCILEIQQHHHSAELLNYVVMPNHIHIILKVEEQQSSSIKESANMGCLHAPKHKEPCGDFHHNSKLGTIIGSFKAAVTRSLRTANIDAYQQKTPIWQPRYHEHIIRDRESYDKIMAYIDNNVRTWQHDCFFNSK